MIAGFCQSVLQRLEGLALKGGAGYPIEGACHGLPDSCRDSYHPRSDERVWPQFILLTLPTTWSAMFCHLHGMGAATRPQPLMLGFLMKIGSMTTPFWPFLTGFENSAPKTACDAQEWSRTKRFVEIDFPVRNQHIHAKDQHREADRGDSAHYSTPAYHATECSCACISILGAAALLTSPCVS